LLWQSQGDCRCSDIYAARVEGEVAQHVSKSLMNRGYNGHCMLGDPVDSQWALRNGLINKVVAPEDLMDNAMQWAQKIVALDPFTVKAAREIAVNCQFLDLNDIILE
jgi:enoyl-CoA hydratase/carnithine racemase